MHWKIYKKRLEMLVLPSCRNSWRLDFNRPTHRDHALTDHNHQAMALPNRASCQARPCAAMPKQATATPSRTIILGSPNTLTGHANGPRVWTPKQATTMHASPTQEMPRQATLQDSILHMIWGYISQKHKLKLQTKGGVLFLNSS